jgi:hypothetical protein
MSSDTSTISDNPTSNTSDNNFNELLEQSLLAVSFHPCSPFANPDFIQGIPMVNQPRRLESMSDTADYFVDKEGCPLVLVFPAELDLRGKFNRNDLYFGQPAKVI